MSKFLLGFVLSIVLVFAVGSHSDGLREQLEYEVCYNYSLCYGYEWVDCRTTYEDGTKGNCSMDRMWVIYTDEEQISLRFLGANRVGNE